MGQVRRAIAALLMVLLVGCSGSAEPPPAYSTTGTVPSSGPASGQQPADPEPTTTAMATTSPIPAPAQTLPDGMQRSGVASSGEFEANSIISATSHAVPDERLLVVEVETSVPESVDGAALLIHQTLESPRGWAGYRGVAFSLVSDAEQADLVIRLASPQTVDAACTTLDTAGLWSCRLGADIYLNADRWFYGTPTWAGQPIGEYRSYLINHEVGHYLGFDHVGCPAQGQLSPVMQQQSIALNGCLPNAWPDVTAERDQ